MQNMINKAFVICLVFFLCLNCTADAQVFTREKTQGMSGCVYVAGSHSDYPMEYYSLEDKKFMGIIPDLLERISAHTGVDFVYINGGNQDKESLGENRQVEIVSTVVPDEEKLYCKEYLELIKYETDENTVILGLVFTALASDDLIASVKAAVASISQAEKTGIILSHIGKEKPGSNWIIPVIILCVLLAALLVVLLLKIKKIKESHTSEKLTDPETGMGNLVYFKHHFRHTMGDMARKLYYVAYIALDDSYVKSFYGEDSFENIVKHTALILSEHAYDREITARVSENGFVIALQSANDAEARERIETIVSRLNEAEDIKDINGKALFHVAVYNLNISDKNCEMVLFNLKKNCNKISGTENQIVFCDTNLMNRVQEEKKLTQSILNGLENNEFKIYLQFIVDNKTKKIVSAEALSRWESPAKGLINPGEYIETMEMSGLISKHDFLMFDLACKQLEAWKGTALENISISCNFTRITLSEGNFADRLKMIADSYAFDKSKLAIEITEDAMEKNQEVAMENVAKCKALGLRVYLDDLGSGYTTLINLCDYPIDVVKIDRDILNKADTLKGKELFFGIVALAHNLNIKVICEGVETEEQCEFVTKTECDLVQGWYYSKALPVEECEDFIKTRI